MVTPSIAHVTLSPILVIVTWRQAEANRSVSHRTSLFAREGCSLRGGWALAGERVGVISVGVVAGVASGSRCISAGLGGLASPADVGAEVAGVSGGRPRR